MKKLMLIALAFAAASAQAKVTCTVSVISNNQLSVPDFEVTMNDTREHSHNNEMGILQIDEKGKVSNMTEEMPGDQIQVRLKGKTLILIERAKLGYDQISIAKVTGKGGAIPGISKPGVGNSAVGTLDSKFGLGLSLAAYDLMVICKTAN